MAKYAVIDIGTNSIKLCLAEKDVNGNWSVVFDGAEISRLGEGLHATGELTPAAMDRTRRALAQMLNVIRQQGAEQVVAVGTMCLRMAKNARDFIARVHQDCGVTIEIISGAEEARLAYLAVKSGIAPDQGRVLMVDAGGGSTEFIVGRQAQIETCVSLNVGAVAYTEQFLISDPVTPAEFDQAVDAIAKDLAALHVDGNVEVLIGIGGGVTNLSAVKQQLSGYDPVIIQGSTLELSEINRQIDLYRTKTRAERKQIVGLQPKRADVILAGAAIIREIMRKVEVDIMTVSDRGLRHGLLLDRFNRK